MNVCIVTGIFPPDHGGPASYVPNIAQKITDTGSVSCVVTLSDDLNHNDKCYPYDVVRIPRGMNKVIRYALCIYNIYKQSKKADVVYVNGLFLESVLAIRLLTRKCLVCKIVGDQVWEAARNKGESKSGIDDFQKSQLGIKWGFIRFSHRATIRLFHKVIVPSKYLENIVLGWGVSKDKLPSSSTVV